jgi:hypothetical protein
MWSQFGEIHLTTFAMGAYNPALRFGHSRAAQFASTLLDRDRPRPTRSLTLLIVEGMRRRRREGMSKPRQVLRIYNTPYVKLVQGELSSNPTRFGVSGR